MTGNEESVIAILAEEWGAIDALAQGLADAEWELPSECPGWTVRDVLSHLIGIERVLLGEASPPPLAELPAHVENEVGARNEAWVASRRSLPGPEILREFQEVTARRISELRSWPAVPLRRDRPEPGRPGPVPRVHARPGHGLLGARTGHPCCHRPTRSRRGARRRALDRPPLRGDALRGGQASGSPRGCVGAVRPARPVVASDRRRSCATAGPRPWPWWTSKPTTFLDMDVEVFWRLACGRVDGKAAHLAGLVDVGGDEALASRVLDCHGLHDLTAPTVRGCSPLRRAQ